MKFYFLALSLTFMANAANAGNLLTCELRTKNNKAIMATIDLSKSLENGVDSQGNGLNIGRDNYSFGMAVQKENGLFDLQVIFYENNNVQDEVGSTSCKFKTALKPSMVCQEPIRNEGKIIAQFSCINH